MPSYTANKANPPLGGGTVQFIKVFLYSKICLSWFFPDTSKYLPSNSSNPTYLETLCQNTLNHLLHLVNSDNFYYSCIVPSSEQNFLIVWTSANRLAWRPWCAINSTLTAHWSKTHKKKCQVKTPPPVTVNCFLFYIFTFKKISWCGSVYKPT
jgi:hypothetical protein